MHQFLNLKDKMNHLMRMSSVVTGNSVKAIMEFKTKINRDMKRLSTICMAALLLMAVSCKKDKQTEVENAGSGFRATVESHEGDSKTHLDGVAVKWDSNDEILVQSNTCAAGRRFALEQIEEGGEADFNPAGTLPEGFYSPNYTAGYPASDFSFDESINIELPSTQTYVENSFGNGANPMIAQSATTELRFKNICGLLRLSFTGTDKVKRIVVLSKNANDKLCGKGTITWNEQNLPVLTMTEGSPKVVLNCGEGVQLSDTPKEFTIVVPAGVFSNGFTVRVINTEGNICTLATTQDNTIIRNKIIAMPQQANVFKAPVGVLSGKFSVAEGRQVRFSSGNLQATYQGSDKYAWSFAPNQYTAIGPGNNCLGSIQENDVIDLFGWSTSQTYYGISVSETPSDYYGEFVDWGKAIDDFDTWRTLTYDEWQYLFGRGKHRFGVTVIGVSNCLVIAPDNFEGTIESSYYSWTTAQNDGLVCLPITDRREGSSMANSGWGYYWSSTPEENSAYRIFFKSSFGTTPPACKRTYGFSVRLVQEL